MSGWQEPQSAQNSLFAYNTNNQEWYQSNRTSGRPSSGAYAEAPNLGLGFYLGGELDNGSAADTQSLGNDKTFLEGLVILNLTDHTSMNITTASLFGNYPRTRGGLQYVPTYGSHGVLITFGGTNKSVNAINDDEFLHLVPMDEIVIFDISSLYSSNIPNATNYAWNMQIASGDIPDSRYLFCVVGTAAPDNSSYNTYLYGGSGVTNSSGFVEVYYDDVYVLSLPSFTWTKVYSDGSSPRTGHTCHLVGQRQMLTVGGAPFGDLQTCDWESKGVAILDMTNVEWGSVFNADAEPYGVPGPVLEVINGSAVGNASLCSPPNGFTNTVVARLFNTTSCPFDASAVASSTPFPVPEPQHRAKTGAIIGGVIGAVVAILLLSTLFWYCCRRCRRRASKVHESTPVTGLSHGNFTAAHYTEKRGPAELQASTNHPAELLDETTTTPMVELASAPVLNPAGHNATVNSNNTHTTRTASFPALDTILSPFPFIPRNNGPAVPTAYVDPLTPQELDPGAAVLPPVELANTARIELPAVDTMPPVRKEAPRPFSWQGSPIVQTPRNMVAGAGNKEHDYSMGRDANL